MGLISSIRIFSRRLVLEPAQGGGLLQRIINHVAAKALTENIANGIGNIFCLSVTCSQVMPMFEGRESKILLAVLACFSQPAFCE